MVFLSSLLHLALSIHSFFRHPAAAVCTFHLALSSVSTTRTRIFRPFFASSFQSRFLFILLFRHLHLSSHCSSVCCFISLLLPSFFCCRFSFFPSSSSPPFDGVTGLEGLYLAIYPPSYLHLTQFAFGFRFLAFFILFCRTFNPSTQCLFTSFLTFYCLSPHPLFLRTLWSASIVAFSLVSRILSPLRTLLSHSFFLSCSFPLYLRNFVLHFSLIFQFWLPSLRCTPLNLFIPYPLPLAYLSPGAFRPAFFTLCSLRSLPPHLHFPLTPTVSFFRLSYSRLCRLHSGRGWSFLFHRSYTILSGSVRYLLCSGTGDLGCSRESFSRLCLLVCIFFRRGSLLLLSLFIVTFGHSMPPYTHSTLAGSLPPSVFFFHFYSFSFHSSLLSVGVHIPQSFLLQ